MSPWKVILATLVIYGAGVVTGAIVTRNALKAQPRPVVSASSTNAPVAWALQRQEFVRSMAKKLDLTPEQREKVEALVKESHERLRPVLEQSRAEVRQELRQLRERVMAELTPEQQKKFEEITRPKKRSDRPDRKGQTNNPANKPDRPE